MAAGKPFSGLLLAVLFLLSAGFAKPISHQSLVLRPLSFSPPLNSDVEWSETLTTESRSATDSVSLSESDSMLVRLAHRDSLSVNATAAELLAVRLARDSVRVKSIINRVGSKTGNGSVVRPRVAGSGFSSSIVSGLSQGSGEYFTRVGVGTPARAMFLVVDTGSDVVWMQCSPCRRCYSQSDPVFNPSMSSSFADVPCSSSLCRQLDVSGCGRRRTCLYQVSYGDGSFTVGDLSTETLTFRRTPVGHVAIGCGHDNEGLFVGAAGLLGLGRGDLSFPMQASRQFGRRFSYCLSDRQTAVSPSSSLIFGSAAVPASGTVFTPMVSNPKMNTFYYIELAGISVGGDRVNLPESQFRISGDGNGGVIIDSGTSVTRLVSPAYAAMRDAFRSGTTHLRRNVAGFSLFDTCYNLSGQDVVKVPTVVFHFAGGSDLSLPASNYLIPVDTSGTFCFAFAGTNSGLSIIGNIQQQGIRVSFDSSGSRVGFAPHNC